MLVTQADRKTRLLKAHKAASKRTQDVMDVSKHIFFQTSSNEIKTVTPERGKTSVQTNESQMNLT
ncbi:hypothetical protein G9403_04295 [Weissella paramesenteroides]|uniref:Uncharacterized protein n=1 Tax=Weissella paramesenteroides TaxID=1249 RepID=A0ABD4XI80_WEIPA|nr:hypothetical protein [Weissella paramesenteroides]MDF8368726.1 hypothetical protein [Weissella paramesenteroides]MDF8370881.1 hypothetical protein [Weissella paramesenteroides]